MQANLIEVLEEVLFVDGFSVFDLCPSSALERSQSCSLFISRQLVAYTIGCLHQKYQNALYILYLTDGCNSIMDITILDLDFVDINVARVE